MGGVKAWFRAYPAVWGSVVATAVLLGGFAIIGRWQKKDADENGPALIERATLVRLADGSPRMLIVESVEHGDETSDWKAYRLSLVRTSDGVLETRSILGDHASIACEQAVPGRLWCERGGIQLRDAATLAVIADRVRDGDILEGRSKQIDRETGALHVLTKDGYETAIDARTIEPTRMPPPPHDRLVVLGRSEGAGSMSSVATTRYALSNGTRRRLLVDGAPAGDRSFLSPLFLAELDGGRAIVVGHKTSLDEKAARWLFTALSEKGDVLWESGDENGTLFAVHHDDKNGALAIVVSNAARYMLGLDTKTGRLLYRYDTIRKK